MYLSGAQYKAQITAEIESVSQELASLNGVFDFTATDEYVERMARRQLGMIMPGEVKYVSSD